MRGASAADHTDAAPTGRPVWGRHAGQYVPIWAKGPHGRGGLLVAPAQRGYARRGAMVAASRRASGAAGIAAAGRWRLRGSMRRRRACGLPGGRCALLQDGQGPELFAFEHLQKGPAAGRDVAHLPGDAVLGDGRERVAAAGNAECGRFGNRPGDGAGAAVECGKLEHPDRAVPDDGAGAFELPGQAGRRGGGGGPKKSVRGARRGGGFGGGGGWGANRRATTTSVGIGTSAPRAFSAAITDRAAPCRSGSARLLPIGRPAASMKVLAMPPPTMS